MKVFNIHLICEYFNNFWKMPVQTRTLRIDELATTEDRDFTVTLLLGLFLFVLCITITVFFFVCVFFVEGRGAWVSG